MSKTIQDLIREAFGNESDSSGDENVQKLLDITLTSWQQVSDSISRTAIFIFILGAAFEILVSAKAISSISFGGLSFSNTSLLQQFIPALMAYLFYYSYCLIDRFADHSDLYNGMLEKFRPELNHSGLMLIVEPQIYGPWSFSTGQAFESDQISRDRFNARINAIIGWITLFMLPFGFEFQAYYTLIHRYGFTNIYVWLSAAISAFFLYAFTARILIDISYTRSWYSIFRRRYAEPRN